MAILGAVELGGTKTLIGAGTGPEDLVDRIRIDTTDPSSTLDQVAIHLTDAKATAVGVGSFGPIEVRSGHPGYGRIIRTPKPGWSHTDVAGQLTERLGLPLAIDTDVNAAALGERAWGATAELANSSYVTVGTGIGGGVLVDGKPLHGVPHPEVGHTVVVRLYHDDHRGTCPYHGDCLEGMASGPALVERFGVEAKALQGGDLEAARDLVAFYLAQGLRNLVYVAAPERIVVGGGVSKLPGFHEALSRELKRELAGYPGVEHHEAPDFVVAPGLGDLSGLAGALILAQQAAG